MCIVGNLNRNWLLFGYVCSSESWTSNAMVFRPLNNFFFCMKLWCGTGWCYWCVRLLFFRFSRALCWYTQTYTMNGRTHTCAGASFQHYVCNALDLVKVGQRRNGQEDPRRKRRREGLQSKTGASICATGLSFVLSTNFELSIASY